MNISKVICRSIATANGFLYDYLRFLKYSGWKENLNNADVRQYHAVKTYHSLEKSMSYKSGSSGHGWSTAFTLLNILKKADKAGNIGFHDKKGLEVLNEFVSLEENRGSDNAKRINNELNSLNITKIDSESSSVKHYSQEEFNKGILDNPEDFFHSRYTLREFKQEAVDNSTIQRAISLAIKTPSVCNRQPWHVYYTSEKNVIDSVMKLQAGNRGFGHAVPNVMIVTADLTAFMPGKEHYQHWIDGGLISMSLIYAFHSLGIASCCLNWSQAPKGDMNLRKKLNIKDSHTVILILAFGWPDSENKVCVSERRSLESFSTNLTLKS